MKFDDTFGSFEVRRREDEPVDYEPCENRSNALF